MSKISFRDILAVIFLLLSVGIIISGVAFMAANSVSEGLAQLIGGVFGTIQTLLTLIVQYYFRKKPETVTKNPDGTITTEPSS